MLDINDIFDEAPIFVGILFVFALTLVGFSVISLFNVLINEPTSILLEFRELSLNILTLDWLITILSIFFSYICGWIIASALSYLIVNVVHLASAFIATAALILVCLLIPIDTESGIENTDWAAQPVSDNVNKKVNIAPKNNTIRNKTVSFSKTSNWILSKVKLYSEEYEERMRHVVNADNNSKLDIGNCYISSIITATERQLGSEQIITKLEFKYDRFKLSEISDVSFQMSKMGNNKRNFTHPILMVKFKSKTGLHRSYKNNRMIDTRSSDFLSIHFTYQGGENDLVERVKKAFMHLKELAVSNPECQKNSEPF